MKKDGFRYRSTHPTRCIEVGAVLRTIFKFQECQQYRKGARCAPYITKPFNLWNQNNHFEQNVKDILFQLNKSKYSEKLKNALLRYVRALDERDQNNALIKLWGAIESLTSPSGANGDLVIKRCAFLHSEYNFHMQILEHLRAYRNQSVHAGDQLEEVKNHCYQLQFYFDHLMRFHINKAAVFLDLEKANEFLDLPPDKESLLRKKELIESALSFVG